MRRFVIALLIGAAPFAAQAADCPKDLSAVKPYLSNQERTLYAPQEPSSQMMITMFDDGRKQNQEIIEKQYQHKLTFKDGYAINDAKDEKLMQEIDDLNLSIELVNVLRCKLKK